MNTINRLQFRHHPDIFNTREEAIEYIQSKIRFADKGLAFEDPKYGYSLLAEPTVLLYRNENEDSERCEDLGSKGPHVIIAIGSKTNETSQYCENKFCIIDIDKTEEEISDLGGELEKAVKGLAIFTRDTNTLKLYSEKTDDGTIISGDVVVATSQIFDDARKPNIILSTDGGLFTYVNMEYDKDNDLLTFTVNGETKQWLINNNYLIGGWYSKKDESLHLKSKDDSEIVIPLESLIDEWGVEGVASNTPIVLTRENVKYGDNSLHNHVEPWQDVLKADIRLADRKYNILKKTSDGRYLYVDGLANNITFFKDGEEMTVQEALANAVKGVSNDSTNIIYEKADGYYATAALKYLNKENKLVFTTSNVTGGTTTEEIKLNSVEAFKKIVYDPVTETLIIMYVDGNGDIQECDVPIGEMMQDWEWDIVNDGHNVKLHKQRVIGGNDKVSADAAIYDDPDNILVDKNHELFVKGTADNIRYGGDGKVSDELDKLNANDADINARLNETSGKVDTLRVEFDAEAERATSEEQRIENKLDNEIVRSKEKDAEHDTKISTIEQTIGDGFSTDGHETVTYKFNELSAKTSTISAKTDTTDANLGLLSAKTEAEIVRAKSEEQRIEKKFDDALGYGFDIRNTVKDEFNKEKAERVGEDARLQAEIDALSANTEGRLMDVINFDHSIDVDKTDPVGPVISVNLSGEQIEGMQNVIKLNNDGLYAGVDLDYYFESGTSKNVLVFKTTNGTKTFDLKTNSVVDKIYYDPTREAIIIEYTVDGHRMPDVVVPVHDLINEWRVSEDTNGAIKLYKFRDSGATQNVLYAESIISDHEDNILVNDNGALYVSSAQIDKNKADIAALSERMDAAEVDIDALEDGLAAEVARATGEEQRIEEKLDREIERSTVEDDNLWEALRAEIARSTDKDNEHDREIAEEIQRAKDAERTLHDEVVEETTARISGDTELNTKIDNEIARATGEEQRIEEKLDREIARSTAKDEEHDTKINELRTSLANEIANRTNEDLRLEGLVYAEENRAKTAESAITHALEVEILDRQNGDNALNLRIDNEITRATSEEARIERELNTKINNEATRATSEEQRIEGKLDAEIERSTNKDDDLQAQVNAEVIARTEGDRDLRIAITNEEARAKGREDQVENNLNLETQRAQDAENTLGIKLSAETAARQAEDEHIWRVIRPIEFFDTTTIHNERVRNEGANPDEVRHSVIIAQADDNIITTSDTLGGLYATAKLGYNVSANLLTIYGSDNKILNSVELGPGSLIKDISYDYAEKDLVITYRRAGQSEDTIMKFPVADLFNEWDVQNPSEKSALELHKEDQSTETGTVDIIWGRVLITGDHDGDGKPDQGSDNIIEIRNNGLYASGSAITEAIDVAECTSHELKEVEMAVLGHKVDQECGNGFTYTPKEAACFISAATDMYDADVILDKYVCSAHTRITKVEEDVDCLWQEVNVTQENVLGFVIPPCGINADGTPYHYTGHVDACIISAATSMDDADVLLDEAICGMMGDFTCISSETKMVEDVLGVTGSCDKAINYPVSQGCLLSSATTFAQADLILEEAICSLMSMVMKGSERPTTSTKIIQDPAYLEDPDKKIIVVDTRLSHGNDSGRWQEDEDLVITDYNGGCIESGDSACTYSEFTDTNVLRIVDLTSLGFVPESKYNGLFLSNVWDCGQYTENGEGTPYEKYMIDDSATAENYYDRVYRNGKRYHNG